LQRAKLLLAVLLSFLTLHAQVNILTGNGDNGRTNSNLQETQLSPLTVSSATFGKIATLPVDGQVYSQPLFVSGLTISGQTHNVLFVSTMHNSVYAFDADSAAPLWQVNLGPSVPATLVFGQYGDIANELGILSAGAIDLQSGVLYVVADVLQNGKAAFYLHALDLTSGAERLNGPANLTASVQGSGAGGLPNGTIPFDTMQHIQRPGLLLANGAVSIGFGSHGDSSPFHGWIMSYDASNLSHRVGLYMSTPDGDGGSFWLSGRGPASDGQGNIFAITGNGDYDGVRNFGESFVEFSASSTATLDSYTPVNWKLLSDNDFDISAGPVLINSTHTLIGADKGGSLYVLNSEAMYPQANAQIIQASTGSIFSLAVWTGAGSSNLYVQGEQEPLKCFLVTAGTVNPTPVSVAANALRDGRIGMTISANGSQQGSGILWESTGDYNYGTPGTLHAYDASNLANELWNSDMNSDRDQMPQVIKFVAPTVANGRVYVPGTNVITVYGVLAPADDGNPPPSISTVANAASYAQDAVSPGQLVAIFGSNLGPGVPAGLQLTGSGTVATDLGSSEVLFDGVASPLIFASAGQINAVVPFGVSGDTTQVQVQYQGQVSDPVPMSVAPATPAIFSADASGTGQAAILNQDGSLNSADNPAAVGSAVTLWATGAGQLMPPGIDGAVVSADNPPRPVLAVTAQIGGQAATVLYAGGAPGIVAGVIQVNLQVPRGIASGAAVPLVLRVGSGTSQIGLTLAVGP
jgi:uncharacterized protein (TIGR03437 family)